MSLYSDSGTARRWGLQVGTALVLWLVIYSGWQERETGLMAVLGGWLITWGGLVMMLVVVGAGFVSVRDFFLPTAGPTAADKSRPNLDEVSVVVCLSILAACVAWVCIQAMVSVK